MSLNSDLATWGEPPATPAEQAVGALLDDVLVKIERGQEVRQELLERECNESAERSQQLVHALGLLYECAANVWENSCFERGDDPVAAGILCDPFPGEFRVCRLLGEGAFGKVWLADDLKLGRQVALKTLKLPATSTLGPEVLAALRKEAQHLAKLDHPNIVRVHAWREARGEYFLVLQFVSGGSLADRLQKEKTLSWQNATRYIADVGEALVEAHQGGVIHRDVKPENILWDADKDEALLTDFGISAHLTEPGSVAGTPIYMAPEAFDGHVSPALDTYSLAASLYRLVTGKLPFRKTAVPALILEKLKGLPDPDSHCSGIPEPLERIIRQGLLADPEKRPKLAEFVSAMRGTLNQLLADDLASSSMEGTTPAPVNLQLMVSRRVAGDTYQSVARTKPKSSALSRDMKKVPRSPEQVLLRTGDRVRIEVVADRDGYVTVFNVGPTGNLNLLYPDEPLTADSTFNIQSNRPLHVVDVEMQPPTGRERLLAVWSLQPLTLAMGDLFSLVERSGTPVSRPYRATRDMKRVQRTVQHLTAEEWHVVVLELRHG